MPATSPRHSPDVQAHRSGLRVGSQGSATWPGNGAGSVKETALDIAGPWIEVEHSMSAKFRARAIALAASTLIAAASTWSVPARADIIWSGDFSTGNFKQWHAADSADVVPFWQVPEYGRPIQYGGVSSQQTGDGSLLSLVSSPSRGSPFAAKFTVKNSANGWETRDCDNGVCSRRRTELTVQQTLPMFYNAIPYQTERWMSFSVYVPSDWEEGGTGWGPSVFQLKPLNEGPSGVSGTLTFEITQGKAWTIHHIWSPVRDLDGQVPWQQHMFYSGLEQGGPYPRADFWPEGLKDFPNVAASQAALQSLRKGGWTDWVIHLRFDARGSGEGGTGFLTVWKREESGPWVTVLNVLPKVTTRGGVTFDHGIGYNSPASSNNNGGFGIKTGLYMDKGQVWTSRAIA